MKATTILFSARALVVALMIKLTPDERCRETRTGWCRAAAAIPHRATRGSRPGAVSTSSGDAFGDEVSISPRSEIECSSGRVLNELPSSRTRFVRASPERPVNAGRRPWISAAGLEAALGCFSRNGFQCDGRSSFNHLVPQCSQHYCASICLPGAYPGRH